MTIFPDWVYFLLLLCLPAFYSPLCFIVVSLPAVSQVEVLIAISSVTSPLLFSASGFLSCSVISFTEIFLRDVPTAKVKYNDVKR